MRRSSKAVLVVFLLTFRFSARVFAVGFPPAPEELPYRVISGAEQVTGLAVGHLCSRAKGRSIYFRLPQVLASTTSSEGWTALALYFQNSSADFSAVKLSLYPPRDPWDNPTQNPLFDQALAKDLIYDPARTRAFTVSDQTVYRVLFPIRKEIFAFGPAAVTHVIAVVDCFAEEASGLRIWEKDSDSGLGLYNFWDSAGKKIAAEPSLGRRVAFTFYQGKPPALPPPVVFLTEAGFPSSVWDVLIGQLNYPDGYTVKLSLAGEKSIADLALSLRDAVESSSARYLADWGDGRVDLVGYGLGGLVAERYLLDYRADHRVRRFVALAAPFKGTPWWDLAQGAVNQPYLGKWLLKKFPGGTKEMLGLDSSFSPAGTAVAQQADGSAYIRSLEETALPGGVAYFFLRSNVRAVFKQTLFHFPVSSRKNLGDLLIPWESAVLTTPAAREVLDFEDSSPADFPAQLIKGSSDYRLEFSGPEPPSLTYRHANLLNLSQVREKIVNLLIR